MREFISKLFGFDKQLESLDDLLAYREERIAELEKELKFYKDKVFNDYHVVPSPTNINIATPSGEMRAVKGIMPWAKLRRGLEHNSVSSIKVKELSDEIDEQVKENAK